jgi:hypothetical protein
MVVHPSTATSRTWSIDIAGKFSTDLSVIRAGHLQKTRQITENLRQRYDDDDDQRHVSDLFGHDDMTVDEKMSLLWKDRDNQGVPDDGPDNIPNEEIDVDIGQLPGLETYREIIKQASAYQWLLWRIAAADRLECPGPYNAQKAVKEYILEHMDLQKQFSRDNAPRINVEYHLDWNLFAFHAEQQYSCTVEQVLEQAITITGYGNDVYAATCLQYVSQIWGNMGVHLLRVLQQAVLDSAHARSSPPKSAQPSEDSSAELSISASYRHGKFLVSALGIPNSVAEVGELLAWIAASLRSSPSKRRAVSCWPVASFVLKTGARTAGKPKDNAEISGLCNIGVQFQTLSKSVSYGSSGSCWLDAFWNSVVVQGYSIPRRSRTGSGLEVSIDIMASLVNANYLVNFCGRTILKGFSTMLVVTEVIGSTVFWHLFYNADKAYISYEDARIPRNLKGEGSQTLHQATLATSRHVLGWCKKVSCLAGTWL